ncbi:hypothetical protein L21SP2_2828 [Salinispira pacifica]|uniref:Uncharacterized protein n=1 Tax=Salinispira pacifica TaxID=1307761 RepID=V5WK98_9SPIO|nr:hypothetical protein L21SP2_2828 [Salinispira pacifica]
MENSSRTGVLIKICDKMPESRGKVNKLTKKNQFFIMHI